MAAIKTERILEIVETLARRLIATVDQPAIGLQQNGGTEVTVAIPPVAGTGGGAAGAENALIKTVQLQAVLMALLPFLGRRRRNRLQPGFDRPVLGVEVRQVGNKVLHDRHMRQRINLHRAVDLLHALGAGERIGTVDIHRAGTTNAFAAGTAQRQRRVDIILDVEKRIENHRPAIIDIDVKGVDTRVLAVIRVPAIDAVFAHILGAIRLRPDLAFVDLGILGESEFNHIQFLKSVDARLRLDLFRIDAVGDEVGVNRTIIERYVAFRVNPGKRMLTPVHIVATAERTVDEILAGMRTAAFLTRFRAVDRGDGIGHEVMQLEGFDQIGIPDHRAVGDLDVGQFLPDRGQTAAAAFERFLGAEHGRVVLHGALHLVAQHRRRRRAVGVTQAVEALHDPVAGSRIESGNRLVTIDDLGGTNGGGTTEDHEVDQRVGAEAVSAVNRGATGFAYRHQAGRDTLGIVSIGVQHFTPVVRGNAAHIVVNRRQNRDRLARHVDACKNLRAFGNARKTLMQDRRIEVIEMQEDVVLVLADAAAFTDFHRHAAGDNVTGGKVLRGRRITLHEALAFGVDEITAFAARAFGNEAACAINAGWMELHKFHVLKRQSRTGDHAATVAGAGVGRRRREIGAAVTTSRQHHHLGGEAVNGAVIEVPGNDAGAAAIRRHDEVEREIFDEEFRIVAQRLAIKRVQNGVAGTVGGGTGALHRRTFAIILHVATERALVDLTFFVTREGHAVMLELIDRLRRFHGEILHRVNITEPVGALHGVVKVPLPTVGRHIGERCGNTALCRDRMGACRENLGDAGGLETLLGHAERGAQTGTTGAHDDHVIGVIDIGIGLAILGR
ncbi:hypothetical protein AT6N2_C2837 [Agrobacterium tumefaciens]|nr:hypothetical protein AT6N2_C2837 [Agrobacterium tumefaciens]